MGCTACSSQVTYERLSARACLREFVELPSQLFEHWALEPEVLKKHALHIDTGAPIPDALIERLQRARRFNQGFETVEYTACALLDMALHAQTASDGVDITQFEQNELVRLGMPREWSAATIAAFCGLFSSSNYGRLLLNVGRGTRVTGTSVVEAGNRSYSVAAVVKSYSSGNTIEPRAAYGNRGAITVEPL